MIAAVALSAALLLPATAVTVIETRAAEVTITADGEVHAIPFSTFSSAPAGVELALYADNVAVVSGACEAGWEVGGVEVRAEVPGACTVSARPHDPITGDIAAEPAAITITAEVPSLAPAPAANPAAEAPPAAPSPSHRPVQADPGDSPLPLVVAWAALLGGWGAAIAVNRRDRGRRFS